MFSLKNTKTKRSCRTISQTSTNTNIKDVGNYYRVKYWVKNNKKQRLHGPAKIWYYGTGLIQAEWWYENDKAHRLHGPAEILYSDTGLIEAEEWYENGIEQNKKSCSLTM